MKKKGMNGWGWRPITSRQLYPAFIRSLLEYGLQLRPLTEEELHPLQTLQNKALSAMFSVAVSTSSAALHLLTGLPPIHQRNLVLNAQYINRIHHSTKKDHPATVAYREALQAPANKLSFFHTSVRRNPLWTEVRPAPLLLRPLRIPALPPSPEAPPVVADANAEWQPINQGLLDAWHRRSLTVDVLTTHRRSRVASSLVITTEGAPHPLIAKGHKLHRAQMRAILLWLLGRVAFHQ
ncbi:hypothetical protein HDV05_005237, partial [Chytridiales sp. JEL 0842]